MGDASASNIPAAAGHRSAPRARRGLSSVELATAFDGQLAPVRTSMLYRLSTLGVLLAMVLLPVIYVGLIAAAVAGVWWYAIHGTVVFQAFNAVRGISSGLLIVVAYIAPLLAGSLLVVFMVLPLFGKAREATRPLWVDRREQPLLYAYVDKLCDTMNAPRPVRIDVVPAVTGSAHIDNGLFGLVSRRLVLTIGLPLAASMDLRQFTAVLAHEFGHFAQGGSMRVSYAVFRINQWFFRLAYRRTVADDVVRSLAKVSPHWSFGLIVLTCVFTLRAARLFLKMMAMLSHAVSMHLSRQAEFDADRQAARIVGSKPIADALQALPFLTIAGDAGNKHAKAGWAKRKLPDDLVIVTGAIARAMPENVKDKLTAELLGRDARWFDTHPPLYKRVATLTKANAPGVLKLDAPATSLFRDFDELCKLATIRIYQLTLGDKLQPEHLVPVTLQTAVPPAAQTTAKPLPKRTSGPITIDDDESESS